MDVAHVIWLGGNSMKVRKLVNSILTFGMVLILFISLPIFENTVYAGNALEAKLNISSQKVVKGKTFSLRVYNLKSNQTVTYSSSRPGIAIVDQNGVITGVDNGNATVTAKIFEAGKLVTTLSCSITVGPPAIGIMISKENLEIRVGEQARLSYIIFPINTAEMPVYSSNDESIASVTPGGRVVGEAPGKTHVFCMISKGVYATCEVTVLSDEEAESAEIPGEEDLRLDNDDNIIITEPAFVPLPDEGDVDPEFDPEPETESAPEEDAQTEEHSDEAVTHTSQDVSE